MEYDPEGGCFVKFTFPPELLISSNHLKAFEGEGYLNTEYGKEIIPVEKDFESDVKYAIFQACTYNENTLFVQNILSLKFLDIILPYAKRSTSMFVIEMFKKWTKEDGLSMPIQRTTDSFMDISLFETNDVESIEMTATNYQV